MKEDEGEDEGEDVEEGRGGNLQGKSRCPARYQRINPRRIACTSLAENEIEDAWVGVPFPEPVCIMSVSLTEG